MKQDGICISRPDLKLHKDFLPVIRQKRGYVPGMSVLSLKMLAFARDILDKYSGRFFYDFDFSAFVFLDRLMQEAAGEQEKGRETVIAKPAAQNGEKPLGPKLYIVSPLFQKTVNHLKRENRILPVRERLAVDFFRQGLVWEKMKELLKSEELPLGYGAVVQLLAGARRENGEKEVIQKENIQKGLQEKQAAAILMELAGTEANMQQGLEEISGQDGHWESMVKVLETIIKEKEILHEIYKKVNIEFSRHNFTNFEEEKLCFLGVVKSFENKYENDRFEDLIYKVDSASEREWGELLTEISWAGESSVRIGALKDYLQAEAEPRIKGGAGSAGETGPMGITDRFWEIFRSMDERELTAWSEEYRRIILRHDAVSAAVKACDHFIRENGVQDFSEKKEILLKRLEACRLENTELFRDVPGEEKINELLATAPARLFAGAGKLPEIPIQMAVFDTLSEDVLKMTKRWDINTWESRLHLTYANLPDTPNTFAGKPWIHSVDKVLELLKTSVYLRNSVDDIRKLSDRGFFNMQGKNTGSQHNIEDAAIQEIISASQENLYETFYQNPVWNMAQEYNIHQAIERLNEDIVALEASGNGRELLKAATVRELLVSIAQAKEAMEEFSDGENRRETSAAPEMTNAYMREIIQKDVVPFLEGEAVFSESTGEQEPRYLWNRWFFELHQWQERRIALASAYETLAARYTAKDIGHAFEAEEKDVLQEKGVLPEKEFESRKNSFLEVIQKYSEQHSFVWSDVGMERMRFFTLHTRQGSRLMELFLISRAELESRLPEIFSEQGREWLRSLNQNQWNELVHTMSVQYASREALVIQKQKFENIFHAAKAAQAVYTAFIRNMKNPAADSGELDTDAFREMRTDDFRDLSQNVHAWQIFADTVREYIHRHPEIEQIMPAVSEVKARGLAQGQPQPGRAGTEGPYAPEVSHYGEGAGESGRLSGPFDRPKAGEAEKKIAELFSTERLRALEIGTPEAQREFFNSFMEVHREMYRAPEKYSESEDYRAPEIYNETQMISAPEIYNEMQMTSAPQVYNASRLSYSKAIREIYETFTETLSREAKAWEAGRTPDGLERMPDGPSRSSDGSEVKTPGAADKISAALPGRESKPDKQNGIDLKDLGGFSEEAGAVMELFKASPKDTYRVFTDTVREYVHTHPEVERISAAAGRQEESLSSQEGAQPVREGAEGPYAPEVSHYGEGAGESGRLSGPFDRPEAGGAVRKISELFSEEQLRALEIGTPKVQREFFNSFMEVHREMYRAPEKYGESEDYRAPEIYNETQMISAPEIYNETQMISAPQVYNESRPSYSKAIREIYETFTETLSREAKAWEAGRTPDGLERMPDGPSRSSDGSEIKTPGAADKISAALPGRESKPDKQSGTYFEALGIFSEEAGAVMELFKASPKDTYRVFTDIVREYIHTHPEIERISAAAGRQGNGALSQGRAQPGRTGAEVLYMPELLHTFTEIHRVIEGMSAPPDVLAEADMPERAAGVPGAGFELPPGIQDTGEASYEAFAPLLAEAVHRSGEAMRVSENQLPNALFESEGNRIFSDARNEDGVPEHDAPGVHLVPGGSAGNSGRHRMGAAGVSEEYILTNAAPADGQLTLRQLVSPQEELAQAGSAHPISYPSEDSRTVTHLQARYREELISRLEKMIEEQNTQVEQLLKEQKEMKSLIAVQKEKLEEKTGTENRAYERFVGQLQSELRLERLRRGL